MTSRSQKIAEQKADRRIDAAYRRTCSGVQINIMDIPAIFRAARAQTTPTTTDAEIDAIVVAVVAKVRVN